MAAKQKTIKYSVSCTGVGLHTGVQSTVTFHPADENTGIKFKRKEYQQKSNILAWMIFLYRFYFYFIFCADCI